MKHRLPAAALLLASTLLLGSCAAGPQPAESAQPEETLTQEQIDAISEKYGLESPTPHTPPHGYGLGLECQESLTGAILPVLLSLIV